MALTGARPGELVTARRSQFDERLGVITLSGKAGRRTVPLSAAAIAHFAQLSRSKLPGAYLLTRSDGQAQELPSAVTLAVQTHDRLRIETPGGGGWGRPD